MKKFLDTFGGRKNFNFYLLLIIGLILVFTDKLDGLQYFALMMGNFGFYAYFNVKNKEVVDTPNSLPDAPEA